ncbi:hypothetical protein ACS0TY_003957 [Phlomoides rotata]
MCFFFSGLDDGSKLHLNACSGGAFYELSTERCTKILDGIANNSSDFDVRRGPSQSLAQVGGNDLSRVETMMMTLMDRMNSLSTQQVRESLPPLANVDPNLKMSQSLPQREEVNYMGRNNGQGGWYGQGKQVQQQGLPQPQGQGWFQNAPQQFPGGGTSYVPNARKHENFSYSNPKAAVQFPPGFDPGAKLPNHEGKPTNEDALNLLLKKMENIEEMAKSYKNMEAQVTQMSQQQRTTDFQLGQLATSVGQLATTVGHMQNKGKFPSTTEPNPKEHCKAIELRSGTKYQGPSLPSEDNVEEREPEIEQEAEDDKVSEKDEDEEVAPLSEDEEEKGKMKKKLEEEESAQPVPKWKRRELMIFAILRRMMEEEHMDGVLRMLGEDDGRCKGEVPYPAPNLDLHSKV